MTSLGGGVVAAGAGAAFLGIWVSRVQRALLEGVKRQGTWEAYR